MAGVAEDGGIGPHRAEEARGGAGVAGLLAQLARAGGERILAAVDDAAGDLEREVVDAEAELAHEHEVMVRREGDHIHPVGRMRDDEVALGAAARVPVPHVVQVEHARARDGLVAELFPAGRLAGSAAHDGSKKNAS